MITAQQLRRSLDSALECPNPSEPIEYTKVLALVAIAQNLEVIASYLVGAPLSDDGDEESDAEFQMPSSWLDDSDIEF